MASAAQVAANRENAKHPRTVSEETKESLRTRALKHGLTSKRDVDTVLKGEDKQEFETILNALLSEATLGTAQEILLIKMQAESFWKSQRAGRMEAGAMDTTLSVVQLMDKVPMQLTEEGFGAALAIAYREHSNWFDKLRRYSTTAERTFFRATRELAMIRKAGPQEEIGRPEIGQTEIGYVSQTAETEEIPETIKEPAAEIGCDSQNTAFLEKSEPMTEEEAFALLDKLTTPDDAVKSYTSAQTESAACWPPSSESDRNSPAPRGTPISESTSSMPASCCPMMLYSELYTKRASFTLVDEKTRVLESSHWLALV
jgi:hypothetical protein